ncbi:MAG: zf-HC2 domain-containing protein, partial [Gemmatimonadota bacterium]
MGNEGTWGNEGTMSANSLQADHPTDALPDYVRGEAADAGAIERHLARCGECRDEVTLLRTLAAAPRLALTARERERGFEAFRRAAVGEERASRGSRAGRRGSGGPDTWRSTAWKIAAAIALLLTGYGAWRAVQVGGDAGGVAWNPQAAIDAWER